MNEEYKFKKGNRVKITTSRGMLKAGMTGTVDENSTIPWVKWDFGERHCINQEHLELIRRNAKPIKVNFLLKYELDEDPIEEFETMKQVEARIRELEQDETLQRDSMVVYEIKSKKTVEFETGFKLKAL